MKHVDKALLLPLVFAVTATIAYLWFVLKVTNVLEVLDYLRQTL